MEPYEVKLQRMFGEGKLTLEQFEALRAALPGGESETAEERPPERPPTATMFAARCCDHIPWQILTVAIINFLHAGMLVSSLFTSNQNLVLKFWIVVVVSFEVFLAVGLLKMQRWIYHLTLLLSAVPLVQTIANLVNLHSLFELMMVAFGVLFNLGMMALLLGAWSAFHADQNFYLGISRTPDSRHLTFDI